MTWVCPLCADVPLGRTCRACKDVRKAGEKVQKAEKKLRDLKAAIVAGHEERSPLSPHFFSSVSRQACSCLLCQG